MQTKLGCDVRDLANLAQDWQISATTAGEVLQVQSRGLADR